MLKPKVREVFGFSAISPDEMDERKFSDKDVGRAYQEEADHLTDLVAIFGDVVNFNEFLGSITMLLAQYHEPIEKLIPLFKRHKILKGHKFGNHEIIYEDHQSGPRGQ